MSRSSEAFLPTIRSLGIRPNLAALSARVFLLLMMFAAVAVGVAPLLVTPAVVPSTAPASSFSAARAMQDLAVIAGQPHPVGSPANAAVRDYLLAEIARLGLKPELQRTTVSELSPLTGIAQVTTVENVAVRVPGAAGNPAAVLLTGHYDSVPTTPGAGDCGSCAAGVLETLRAVVAGPRLQNDVIFLFTDAEELGIVGATAFMQQHPWAQDVRLSLVLEGLGTHGSALLYAASPSQGAFVREAIGAMQSPAGYGYLHDVMWKLSGNSGSDLDAFVADGRPGLAFVHLSLDGSQAYHSGADNAAALDARTLQQHGDQALSLVRHFGGATLEELAPARQSEADAVFFSLLPSLVIAYPQAQGVVIAAAAGLLALLAVLVGWRRRAFRLPGMLAALFVPLAGMLLAVGVGTALWASLRTWNTNYHIYSVGGWYGAAWTTGGLVLLGLAVMAMLQWLWRLRGTAASLTAAALLWWALLALLTVTALPGFSHLFAWPLLLAAPLAAWSWWNPSAAQKPWWQALVLALPAVVAFMLLTPVVYGLAVFAGRMEAMLGVPLAALPLPLVVLAGTLLVPQIELWAPVRRWLPPALLLAGALVLLAMGWSRSGFDPAHPKLNSITYWLDADGGRARWISVNDSRAGRGAAGQIDEWTAQFLGDDPAPTTINPWLSGWFMDDYPALQSEAPAIKLAQSEVHVLEDRIAGDVRHLRLQLVPAAGIQDSFIQISGDDGLVAVALNGAPLAAQPQPAVRLNIVGAPQEPVTFDLRAPAGATLSVQVADRRLGLPATKLTVSRRPSWMAAAPFNDMSDSAVVVHTVEVD